MPKVTRTQIVEAPVADVWQTWDQFGAIDAFHPDLTSSHLLPGSAATGLGATRQCNFNDGKNHLRERITDYVPERRLVVDIYEGTFPIKRAEATFTFNALSPNRTEVTMTMDFAPKFGLLGKLMTPLMKPQFGKAMARLLAGNAAMAEGRG